MVILDSIPPPLQEAWASEASLREEMSSLERRCEAATEAQSKTAESNLKLRLSLDAEGARVKEARERGLQCEADAAMAQRGSQEAELRSAEAMRLLIEERDRAMQAEQRAREAREFSSNRLVAEATRLAELLTGSRPPEAGTDPSDAEIGMGRVLRKETLPDFLSPCVPDPNQGSSAALLLQYAPATSALERLRALLAEALQVSPWRLSTNTEDGILVQLIIAAPGGGATQDGERGPTAPAARKALTAQLGDPTSLLQQSLTADASRPNIEARIYPALDIPATQAALGMLMSNYSTYVHIW